ncbi:MAG: DUF885 domain-containing protein, partial [Phycisphaerales bacterium]
MSAHRIVVASLSVAAVVLICGSPISLAQSGPSTPAVAPEAPRESGADRALLRLLDEDLENTKRASPVSASVRGDRRFDRELADVSEAAYLARARTANDMLVRLAQIDVEQLSDENRLNYALLDRDLRDRAAAAAYKPWQISVTNLSGPQQDIAQIADRVSFDTRAQKQDFLARIRQVPRVVEQTIENLRGGIREGRVQPRTAVAATPEQAFSNATDAHAADPTTHPLYKPFAALDPNDPLAREAQRAIRESVLPSMRALGEFLRDEYLPAARASVGASDYPDGAEYYDYMLGVMTTTDLTADEIHELGLSEVARIRAEMMDTIRRSDFMERAEARSAAGDDERLFRAFLGYLRTDGRFYAESADE